MVDLNSLPSYENLPLIEGTEEHHAWGIWGENDNLGTINLLTPEHVAESMKLVKRGVSFNLDLPLDQPERIEGDRGRQPYIHHVYRRQSGGDDSLDHFYLQGSSQIDGLRHVRFGSRGYYTGLQDEDLDEQPGDRLGIQHWAEHGINGRAVLLDFPRFMGDKFDVHERIGIDGPMLEAIAKKQGVEIRPRDILLLRTGWMEWYLNSKDQGPERFDIAAPSPGLDGMRQTAVWLWDHHIASINADNIAVEALPPVPLNFQHRRMVGLFGMQIGELWALDELAEDCAKDGIYEMLLVAKPLNLPRGVGSPPNAQAFK